MNKIIFEKLCLLNPEKHLLPQIKSYENIIENMQMLKYCKYSEVLFKKILVLIIDKSKSTNRFRKNECFKLLKMFRKKADKKLDNETMENILYLFKMFIGSANEEKGNSLSVLLKDISLKKDAIQWLLDNAHNTYVLNRILRYPDPSKQISLWADIQLLNNKFLDRKSELIGRIIDLNENYSHKDERAFAWGIYYARVNSEVKIQMLEKLMHSKNGFDDAVKVATRLDYVDLLERNL